MHKDKNPIQPVPVLKAQVKQVLKEEPSEETIKSGLDSRDSDTTLTIRIWRRFYNVGTSVRLLKEAQAKLF